MRQNEPRIQKISACGAPDMTTHARARIEKKSARNQNFGNQTFDFFLCQHLEVCMYVGIPNFNKLKGLNLIS